MAHHLYDASTRRSDLAVGHTSAARQSRMFSADVRRSAGWAVMAADPAHLFQRLSERQGIMRSGLAARERACQSWTSCVTLSWTVVRAAAVLVGGVSRGNSGGPIRGSAAVTP